MEDQTTICNKCQKPYFRHTTETDLCKSCVEKYPYFLSFIEEWFTEGARSKTFGRVEVYKHYEEYAIDEIRFLFNGSNNSKKGREFWEFEKRWDFQNVTKKELEEVKKTIKNKFYEHNL